MTRRTRGISLPQLIGELRPYLIGWRSYFGFCQTPRVLTNLAAWSMPGGVGGVAPRGVPLSRSTTLCGPSTRSRVSVPCDVRDKDGAFASTQALRKDERR
jgi:Group II intron, maturase-specific domain